MMIEGASGCLKGIDFMMVELEGSFLYHHNNANEL